MIHHSISTFIALSYINVNSLICSCYIIMESISLMNYIWRNNQPILKIYRTLCILCIRIPLILWTRLYYAPNIVLPYLKLTRTNNQYIYLHNSTNLFYFFIMYDMFILWKLYKQKTKKPSNLGVCSLSSKNHKC